VGRGRSRRVPRRVRVSGTFVPPAGLEISADPFPGSFRELRKLPRARIDYCLDLLLGLLADRHHAVQVLVDEEPHEHVEGFESFGVVRLCVDLVIAFVVVIIFVFFVAAGAGLVVG
jgi:hypothetical protein